ncbi:MAG: ribbon-helix-helix domain-containing protein [Blautia sp.]|nr:ribbon-helix-helix domain-containing protein [Blautia sp.]
MEKFVVVPKEDKAVTMTIRIDRVLQEQYNELAAKTNRSRNELIGMALQYALDNMVIQDLKIMPVAIFENSKVGDVDS